MQHFETEQWIPAPLSLVFRFFCDPTNLTVLSPPKAGATLLKTALKPLFDPNGVTAHGLAGVGSEILISVRLLPPLPMRGKWLARITEVVWEQYFADIQVKGPFAQWHHRHKFSAATGMGQGGVERTGTVVRDLVDYELPFGPLGELVEKLIVRRQIETMFTHRQRALAAIFSE